MRLSETTSQRSAARSTKRTGLHSLAFPICSGHGSARNADCGHSAQRRSPRRAGCRCRTSRRPRAVPDGSGETRQPSRILPLDGHARRSPISSTSTAPLNTNDPFPSSTTGSASTSSRLESPRRFLRQGSRSSPDPRPAVVTTIAIWIAVAGARATNRANGFRHVVHRPQHARDDLIARGLSSGSGPSRRQTPGYCRDCPRAECAILLVGTAPVHQRRIRGWPRCQARVADMRTSVSRSRRSTRLRSSCCCPAPYRPRRQGPTSIAVIVGIVAIGRDRGAVRR